MKMTDTSCNWCAWYSHQRIDKETGRFRNGRTSEEHLNYSIIKINQNTEKTPGDFRRLVVTQTPVEDHQLTLVRKTPKGVILSAAAAVAAIYLKMSFLTLMS